MARPELTTTWPNGGALRKWKPDSVKPETDLLFDDIVADATALLLERVDANKLPANADECPRFLARAIVQQAQHMLSGRQATGGVMQVGDTSARIPALAPGVAAAIASLRLDPEA